MSKFLKFIVHFVVICTILCVVALAVPPFFGVTTQIQDDAAAVTNLPMGSVVYAVPTRTSEIQIGDSILVTDNGGVYRLNIASMDVGAGRGQAVDAAVANASPVQVAFGEFMPKVVLHPPSSLNSASSPPRSPPIVMALISHANTVCPSSS